ncbi:MAG: Nif3-like dinuclear metal center hexameric protein [Spirochaetes bacterium]|nr:Nif3-like dinuclear metal center hexameric protein [Spirochaetota bacterium]
MVTRKKLAAWLNEYLSVSLVQDYQPNGLQIEGKKRIARIAAAVSISLTVIERAVSEKADAILVHHGMFWKNDDAALTGYRKERVKRILAHDINLFSYHLPLDLHPEVGHNVLILKGIGASIEPAGESKQKGIGRRGSFSPPISFGTLLKRTDRLFGSKARFFHHGTDTVGSVYVVSGAGRNDIDAVSELGVDAYITGDAKESTPYIASETKMNYIYAGHYNTERLGVEALLSKIKDSFGVDTFFCDIENDL